MIDQHDRSTNLFVDQVLHGRREITLRHHEEPVVSSYREEREAGGRRQPPPGDPRRHSRAS